MSTEYQLLKYVLVLVLYTQEGHYYKLDNTKFIDVMTRKYNTDKETEPLVKSIIDEIVMSFEFQKFKHKL